VYIATPPSSHCELALAVASAGKPCLVEKPMAMNHGECLRMVTAFRERAIPLWVAFYRRALPRFLLVRDLLRQEAIGRVTSVQIEQFDRLVTGDRAAAWRFVPAVSGGGLFVDMGSHALDLVDFLGAPIAQVSGHAVNTGGAYAAEDVTTAAFVLENGVPGTGMWNFNANAARESLRFTGTQGHIVTPVFADGDVIVTRDGSDEVHAVRNPPHVHQPLIQTIVDELQGRRRCESTGESAARTSRVMDEVLGRTKQEG
jgi:predicted dehydrogenase